MSKRRDKAEWQRLIDEQVASGLTQKSYCEQASIPVATFGYWKRKLRTETTAEPARFTEGAPAISLDDWIELPTDRPEAGGSWQIELDLGNGICLRLRQG